MKDMIHTFMNAGLIMPYFKTDKDFSSCIEDAQQELIKDILTFNKFLHLKEDNLDPRLCLAIKSKI
jgi:hypothetical protein